MTSETETQASIINIVRYLQKQRQSDNEIYSVNIRSGIFFRKNHVENETERLVPDLFLIFRKPLYEVKASGQLLSFNMLWQSSTWTSIKTNCMKLQTFVPETYSFFFLNKCWDQSLQHIYFNNKKSFIVSSPSPFFRGVGENVNYRNNRNHNVLHVPTILCTVIKKFY